MRAQLVAFCAAVAMGCEVPSRPDASASVFDSGVNWGNAAAVLNGAPLAPAFSSNAVLTKHVTVTALGDPRFQIVSATLTRDRAGDEAGLLVIRVRNSGSTAACYVSASPLVYLGAGNASFDGGEAFVAGSSHERTMGLATNSCLGPGEDGFLTDIQLAADAGTFYSAYDSVTFGWDSVGGGSLPLARLIPISYAGDLRTDVKVLNTGTRTATQALVLGRAVLLDAAEEGLSWTFLLDKASGTVNTDAGAELHLEMISLFEGSATSLYANVGSYLDCRNCSRAPSAPTTLEEQAALHQRLRDRDVELRDQLRR